MSCRGRLNSLSNIFLAAYDVHALAGDGIDTTATEVVDVRVVHVSVNAHILNSIGLIDRTFIAIEHMHKVSAFGSVAMHESYKVEIVALP